MIGQYKKSEKDMFKKPEKINLGKSHETCMSYIIFHFNEYQELIRAGKNPVTAKSDRYVCGFPLPHFQRPSKWTTEQKIKFIESAWKGVPLGTFVAHKIDWKADCEATKFSGWLVDGQQRLTAIEEYLTDQFEVYGAVWSQVSSRDQRDFKGVKFGYNEIDYETEEQIKDLYILMAYGGVAHTEEDLIHATNSYEKS